MARPARSRAAGVTPHHAAPRRNSLSGFVGSREFVAGEPGLSWLTVDAYREGAKGRVNYRPGLKEPEAESAAVERLTPESWSAVSAVSVVIEGCPSR